MRVGGPPVRKPPYYASLGAHLMSADLREVHNLTQEQLDAVIGDDRTQLPDGLTRPAHWKAEATTRRVEKSPA